MFKPSSIPTLGMALGGFSPHPETGLRVSTHLEVGAPEKGDQAFPDSWWYHVAFLMFFFSGSEKWCKGINKLMHLPGPKPVAKWFRYRRVNSPSLLGLIGTATGRCWQWFFFWLLLQISIEWRCHFFRMEPIRGIIWTGTWRTSDVTHCIFARTMWPFHCICTTMRRPKFCIIWTTKICILQNLQEWQDFSRLGFRFSMMAGNVRMLSTSLSSQFGAESLQWLPWLEVPFSSSRLVEPKKRPSRFFF